MNFLVETRITHQMLCGGDDTTGASTCLGDSGGPYVCSDPQGHWVLQGITSWGSKRCLISERYSVFSKVRVFTNWIENVMNKTTSKPNKTKPEISKKSELDWNDFWGTLLNLMKRIKME